MAADPCQIVDALAAFQFDVLRRINRKFAALRGLAQLLEQLGDINSFTSLIPNIAALIPIVNINLSFYNQLIHACPFLHLPAASGSIGTNQLQGLVAQAYANIYAKLKVHPWNRMGLLQAQMDKFQAQINAVAGQASDFLRCLQAVCATGRAVVGQLNALSDANIGKEITAFSENFVAHAGQVMMPAMSAKYGQIVEGQARLIDLGAEVKQDYRVLKTSSGGVAQVMGL